MIYAGAGLDSFHSVGYWGLLYQGFGAVYDQVDESAEMETRCKRDSQPLNKRANMLGASWWFARMIYNIRKDVFRELAGSCDGN